MYCFLLLFRQLAYFSSNCYLLIKNLYLQYFVDFKLNVNGTDESTDEYRKHFLSYIGVASQVPNVICNALNIFVQFG